MNTPERIKETIEHAALSDEMKQKLYDTLLSDDSGNRVKKCENCLAKKCKGKKTCN